MKSHAAAFSHSSFRGCFYSYQCQTLASLKFQGSVNFFSFRCKIYGSTKWFLFRSNCRRCSVGVLEIFAKFTGKNLCQTRSKVAGLRQFIEHFRCLLLSFSCRFLFEPFYNKNRSIIFGYKC